jgi:signal transduction histidine kinase
MSTRGLLRAAGLLTWAFAGIPAATSIATETTCSSIGGVATIAGWVGAFAVFGVTFFRATRENGHHPEWVLRMLAIQTFAALAMNVALCTGFEAALLVVVAVQLGLALPLRRGLLWLAAQTLVLYVLASHHMGWERSVVWAIAVMGAEAFAFTVAAMAGREAAARQALEKTNAELEATRESLARASRDAERLRIAREMHDLLGHDMIALHLELETARHLTEGRGKETVERAQNIAKTLLADLRRAVSSLRADASSGDVVAEVRAFVGTVQGPRVHHALPESLELGEPERANTRLRCVQEIVTNTIKHAAAENLWITVKRQNGCIELEGRDDGRGAPSVVRGNGLEGMRERMAALGGDLTLDTTAGRGFQVRAVLPITPIAKAAEA